MRRRPAPFAFATSMATLLATGWPGALAAILVLPYAASIAPFLGLSDADCERANAGWRRFIWLNLLTGFLLTQLFIWMTVAS